MSRGLRCGLLALVVLGLAACSTETVVTLQDGTQYLTEDRPNTKTADGFYEFTDVAGRHVRVKASDVATIKAED
ncbi:YgdI/YgdR family lipoprotein [Pseudomonas oryzihabitans]|uniref:Major membrane immunogen (Membrane-anchored lipoprotein) n=1 Tax=Pseudomonas oryzihabitans TaxID=47885 RepID=A0AAJ2BFZ6_9PSED|nr:YgdI/YgdR family lipoprotein [Pseudomonas psychrotolerans]MDR6233419.1 major membrane immunogen (membrane-anchored lipoprotein) [Pseudomonas psychrotolerans]MDR6357551.1 major membrane immunogen (membrane-anchored lipoprotein) [Pseudomonas psychrotolerans]